MFNNSGENLGNEIKDDMSELEVTLQLTVFGVPQPKGISLRRNEIRF